MEEKKTYVCLKCGRVYKPDDDDSHIFESAAQLTRNRLIKEYAIDPDEIGADVTTCINDGFIMVQKDYFNSEKDFIEISRLAKEIYKAFGHRAFMNTGDGFTYVKIGCDSRIFYLILNWIGEASYKFGIQGGSLIDSSMEKYVMISSSTRAIMIFIRLPDIQPIRLESIDSLATLISSIFIQLIKSTKESQNEG